MGNKYHAKCDYCGATEGPDWRKREYKLYCSKDCQSAGEMCNWLCVLLIMGPITLTFIAEFGFFSYAFPILAIFLIFNIGLIYAVYRGIQARNRISQRSRSDDVDFLYLDFNDSEYTSSE
ncbi:MAG: hypothetical protein ACFFEV_00835 [Candidatus Thorarchaeota archaeon]